MESPVHLIAPTRDEHGHRVGATDRSLVPRSLYLELAARFASCHLSSFAPLRTCTCRCTELPQARAVQQTSSRSAHWQAATLTRPGRGAARCKAAHGHSQAETAQGKLTQTAAGSTSSATCQAPERMPLHAQEYKEVSRSKNQDTGITLVPSETNLYSWQAFLKVRGGHQQTPAVGKHLFRGLTPIS
jgi:hypothetical protein